MFFEVLGLTYHSPITIAGSLTACQWVLFSITAAHLRLFVYGTPGQRTHRLPCVRTEEKVEAHPDGGKLRQHTPLMHGLPPIVGRP